MRRALAALGLPERFFLFVGTLEPRKNVAGLLEAFAGLAPTVERAKLETSGGILAAALRATNDRLLSNCFANGKVIPR